MQPAEQLVPERIQIQIHPMPVARAALLTVLSMAAVTVAPAVARRVIREAAVRVPGDILARAAMAAGQLAAAARVPGGLHNLPGQPIRVSQS